MHTIALAAIVSACGHDAEPAAERAPEPAETPEAEEPAPDRQDPAHPDGTDQPIDRGHAELPFAELDPCPEEDGDAIVIDVRPRAFVAATLAGERRVAGDAVALRATLEEWHEEHSNARVLVSPVLDDEPRIAAARSTAREAGFRTIRTCDAGPNAGAGQLGPMRAVDRGDGYSTPIPRNVASRVPRVSYEVAASGGGLDEDAVRSTLRRRVHDLRDCYQLAREDDDRVEGEVDLAVTIHPSGAVSTAGVTRSTVEHDPLRECIRYAVLRWDFRAADAPTSATIDVDMRLSEER